MKDKWALVTGATAGLGLAVAESLADAGANIVLHDLTAPKEAADRLAAEGTEAEVLDLRTLKPLDEEAILETARKTGKVLIVHSANRLGGVGAEVAPGALNDGDLDRRGERRLGHGTPFRARLLLVRPACNRCPEDSAEILWRFSEDRRPEGRKVSRQADPSSWRSRRSGRT